jgi:glyoxylase-like metal-dependent hydrolase (beta-lactamase superfamily II)
VCMQAFIIPAIASVSDMNITHFVYSHTHQDHESGAGSLNFTSDTIVLANEYAGTVLTERAVQICVPSPMQCDNKDIRAEDFSLEHASSPLD